MGIKREALMEKYAADIAEKFGETPDLELLHKVTTGLGPSIYNADASRVSSSDEKELITVKNNFLVKKLGLTDGPELLEVVQQVVEKYGRSEKNKHRAVIYYILAKHFGRESVYGQ